MIRKNELKRLGRGFRDEFTSAITGEGLRQAKKTRNKARDTYKLALKIQKENKKNPAKPIAHNIANEQKIQSLRDQAEKQLQHEVDLFRQHGNRDVFDTARKSIMDNYNKEVNKLGGNSNKRSDFASRVVDSTNYHHANRIAQNNVDEAKKILDKANAVVNARRIKTHGTRITMLAGVKALNDKTYGKMMKKQKEEQRQNKQDRLTELQIRDLRAKERERKALKKQAFDYIDNLYMEKLSEEFTSSDNKPSIDYKNLEVDPKTGKIKLPWDESQVVSRIKVNNPATGKPIVMTTYKDASDILDEIYMKKVAMTFPGKKKITRYKELLTGSKLKQLNNNIEKYDKEINKIKKDKKHLDDMWNRALSSQIKMNGMSMRALMETGVTNNPRTKLYDSQVSRLENLRENLDRKADKKNEDILNLIKHKVNDENSALQEEDLIKATRKKTKQVATGVGIASTTGTIGAGGVLAYKHHKKKQLEKQASINPLYMTKRLGTRFGKFGNAGRSGIGGVGVGMPGASGTGITPQKAVQLHNTIPSKDEIVSNIKGSLSMKQNNKIKSI